MKVRKIPRITAAIPTTPTATATVTIRGRGVLSRYLLELPNMATTATVTLSITDENSITIFTGAAHAVNGNFSIPIDVEIDGTYTVTLTLNAATATAGSMYSTFWLRGM